MYSVDIFYKDKEQHTRLDRVKDAAFVSEIGFIRFKRDDGFIALYNCDEISNININKIKD